MGMTSAASWPSEPPAEAKAEHPAPPRRQRSEGRAGLVAARIGSGSRVADLAESGILRLRLPRHSGAGLEAVLVNTAGGIACGDRTHVTLEAQDGAHLTLATPSAEKVYRSDGETARLDVALKAGAGARLEWLPQETILFDAARLDRRFEVDLHPDAHFLSFEALMLGRIARGEPMAGGHLIDQWRVRRGGGLVYADALRLSGPIGALLARPAIANGNRALGTVLYIAPDASARLEEARDLLAPARSECGASTWNGILAARFLAPDIETLRADATSFLMGLRGAPMPRVWAT